MMPVAYSYAAQVNQKDSYCTCTRINGIRNSLLISGQKRTCKEGELKLFVLDPPDARPNIGWLQFCFHDEWGTVCDEEWDFLDSTVACQQLGYIGGFHGN